MGDSSPMIKISLLPEEASQLADNELDTKPTLPSLPQFKSPPIRKSFFTPRNSNSANLLTDEDKTNRSPALSLFASMSPRISSHDVPRASFSMAMGSCMISNVRNLKKNQCNALSKPRNTVKLVPPKILGLEDSVKALTLAQKRLSKKFSVNQSSKRSDASQKNSSLRKFQRNKANVDSLTQEELTDVSYFSFHYRFIFFSASLMTIAL